MSVGSLLIAELGKEVMEYRLSEIELVYKHTVPINLQPRILKSEDAYNAFLSYWDQGKIEFIEQFKILLLNRANRVLGIVEISSGTTNATLVDVKMVFVSAMKANAHSIILCHNHPSGNMEPSKPDIQLTDKMKKIGELLEIKVVDHLIISPNDYYSFSDNGYI